jgi:predicted MFS family arabinose efflux permease
MDQQGPEGRIGRALLTATAWILRTIERVSRFTARLVRGEVVKRVGGPVRARVIVLFAIVLALNGADLATIGAVAPQLRIALHINTTQIGLLNSVALFIGAIATIPVGLLVDRIKRLPILALSIILWSVASVLSAIAANYTDLLLSRLLLGAVIATAGPTIASLTGDFFPASERGRVWAYILTGELAGNALGFIVCGTLSSAISWRAPFVVLALPGLWLAWVLYRTVPEPRRGGQSHLQPGAAEFVRRTPGGIGTNGERVVNPDEDDLARVAVRRLGVRPEPTRILGSGQRELSLLAAIRYILSIPTNLLMIFSSSLGYFYFAGLSTFALLFVEGHYHVGTAGAELFLAVLVIGGLIGTLISGRLTDALLKRGMISVRVWIPAICYLLACLVLIPGFLATRFDPAIWLDSAGAGLLLGANAPLNAARLDTMPAALWGRAESTRTLIRSLAEALSPLLFGALAQLASGVLPSQAPIGTHPHANQVASDAPGLQVAFLVLLVSVLGAGILLLRARVTYPGDVATAAASDQANKPDQANSPLANQSVALRTPGRA